MICKNCSKEIPDDSTTCEYCNMAIETEENKLQAGDEANQKKGSDKPQKKHFIKGRLILSLIIAATALVLLFVYAFIIAKPDKISFENKTIEIEQGESQKLGVHFKPENVILKGLKWKSSKPDIATVEKGIVTGIKQGITEITATTINGITATCYIRVVILPDEITLDKKEITIDYKRSTILSPTVLPENTNDKTIYWSSSDEKIAGVDNGVVTARSGGSAIITAKTANGKIAECKVNVLYKDVVSVQLVYSEHTMKINDYIRFSYDIMPFDASEKDVTYTTNDTSVINIDSTGLITGIGVGTATVTAHSVNGKTDECIITVLPYEAESLKIIPSSVTLALGNIKNLRTEFTPAQTTDKTLIWTSSDTGVITVDAKGLVSVVGAGKATVTAKAINGVSDSCEITVLSSYIHYNDFLGKPLSQAIEFFGNDYSEDSAEGSFYFHYDNCSFLINFISNGKEKNERDITYICVNNGQITDTLFANMTYDEIKSAAGNAEITEYETETGGKCVTFISGGYKYLFDFNKPLSKEAKSGLVRISIPS